MNKKIAIALASSLLVSACGDSDSSSGGMSTIDGEYTGTFSMTFDMTSRLGGPVKFVFSGNTVWVTRGSANRILGRGVAQVSGNRFTIVEDGTQCRSRYIGSVGRGKTRGTIAGVDCSSNVAGTFSATR